MLGASLVSLDTYRGVNLHTMRRGLASAERVFTLVDRVPRVPVNEGLEPTETVVGDVEFCDVWFQYDGRDKVQ